MNLFIYKIIILSAFISCSQNKLALEELSPNIEKNDLNISQWYLYQIKSIDLIAGGKYNFNKMNTNTDEIIRIQKMEIRKNYKNKYKVENWLILQNEAISVLSGKKVKMVKMKQDEKIEDLLKVLEEQELLIKNM